MLELHSPLILTIIQIIELAGVAIISGGAAVTLILFLARIARSQDRLVAFNRFRSGFGRAILLGLEFLVAADIINTITVEMTLQSVASLGMIVIIRTLLSFSLEVEIEGRWPWQRGQREPRSD